MVKYVGYGWFDTPYLKPLAGCPQEYLGRPMRPETPSEIRLVPHSARYVGSDTSGGDASDNHDIPNAIAPVENSFLKQINDCKINNFPTLLSNAWFCKWVGTAAISQSLVILVVQPKVLVIPRPTLFSSSQETDITGSQSRIHWK